MSSTGASELRVEASRDGGVLVISVLGELDVFSSRWLTEFLDGSLDGRDARVVIDLARLRLCDGASMSALLLASGRYRERGGWLRVAAPTGMVARAFAVVALNQVVPTYRTVEAAASGDDSERIKD